MKLTFVHAGQERTLAKHPAVQRDLRTGAITERAADTKAWYLRFTVAGKARSFKLPATERDAIHAAKEILNGHTKRPDEFKEFLEAKDARRSITIGKLADEWLAAGLPFRKTGSRTPVAAINSVMCEDYAGYRAPARGQSRPAQET